MDAKGDRIQSIGEEIANALSHGVGAVTILAASPFLLMAAFERGGILGLASAGIFAVSVALLYSASTLYHAFPAGRAKRVFQVLDHTTIFVLIAGTYTPFTLGVLWGPWGWSLLGAVWSLAVIGVVIEAVGGNWKRYVSMSLYLAMGWLVVVAIVPLFERVGVTGIALLAAGGLAYTGGVGFYAMKRVRYAHLVWHLFVLAGTSLHFVAVLRYAI